MYNLTKRYQEPHRKYHSLQHIFSMFKAAEQYNLQLTKEQIMAIWFHDAVYVPGAKDNEEKSVDVFNQWCYDQKYVAISASTVRQIILDTKEELPTIEESKLVIDLDLHNLGTEAYQEQYELSKAEFVPNYFSMEEYVTNRIKWLEKFLNRKSIFVSDIYPFTVLEKQARYNLEREYKTIPRVFCPYIPEELMK